LAEGDLMYQLVDGEEWTPKEMKFLKEMKVQYEGKEAIFYIFKLDFGGKEDYLGYAGPYYTDNKTLVNSADATSLGGEYVKGLEEAMLYEYIYKKE